MSATTSPRVEPATPDRAASPAAAAAPAPAAPGPNVPAGRTGRDTLLVLALVILFHLLPLAGEADCHTMAVIFALLSAGLLTARVMVEDNPRLRLILRDPKREPRVWAVQLIGAALAFAWAAPFYVLAHGAAESSIAALGVAVSILCMVAVSDRANPAAIAQDVATVLVVVWAYLVCHLIALPRGEEFLSAVTVGSSSLHSWKTALGRVVRYWRP